MRDCKTCEYFDLDSGKCHFPKEQTYIVMEECKDSFQVWWDPQRFDWDSYSYFLPWHLKDKFEFWWDPKRFNWKPSALFAKEEDASIYSGSWALLSEMKEEFPKWWDPERFDWESCSSALPYECPEYFDYWWHPEKIVIPSAVSIYGYCCNLGHKIDIWMPVFLEKFECLDRIRALPKTVVESILLAALLSDGMQDINPHIEQKAKDDRQGKMIWELQEFDWENDSWILVKYYLDYFTRWAPDQRFTDEDTVLEEIIKKMMSGKIDDDILGFFHYQLGLFQIVLTVLMWEDKQRKIG